MSFAIELPRPIEEGLVAEIEKESVYISPHLRQLRVTPDRTAVDVESDNDLLEAEVEGKTRRFLDAMLKNMHSFETKIYRRNVRRDEGPFTADVHGELQRRGWLYDYGGGHVALTGPAQALAKVLDERAEALYHRHFNATTGMYPALVDAELLARCGYFESHPNAVTFIGHVIDDFDLIETFRQANTGTASAQLPPHEHVHLPGKCLNPAACFPCYPTLAHRAMDEQGEVVTWQGRVFRYESRNTAGLDRLWEFNVRELVFVGSDPFVVDAREQALEVVCELAALFDVACSIETAADPFFASVSAAKTFWQRTQEVKYEIRLPVAVDDQGAARTIAAGSLNLHGDFFGRRFDIAAHDSSSAYSGCVGLGIERWVLAAFAQHGFDPARWPDAVRDDIFD